MCYNAILINKTKKEKKIGNLLSAIFSEFRINKDGAFMYNSSNNLLLRTLDYKAFSKILKSQQLDSDNLIHMHLRLASSGSVSQENIHGWRFGNWLCSHNGSYIYATNYFNYNYYYKYYEGKKDKEDDKSIILNGKSDSFEFFEKNAKYIEDEDIDKIDVEGFYGVAYCNNISNNHLIIISKNKSAKLYYLQGLLLISNEELDNILSKYYKIGDLEFTQKPMKSEIENKIILIDTKTLKILKEKEIEVYSTYYKYYKFDL